jgi:hypothetical protein
MTVKYAVLDVVAASILCTEQHGFVAKKDATVDTPSTASRVQQTLLNIDPEQYAEVWSHVYADAGELIEWSKENLRGEFGYSVKDIINKQQITLPQTSFLVTLPNFKRVAEEREISKEIQAESTKNSEWFGVVRKRDDFFVKLTNKKYVPNYDSYIYNIQTREGNIGSFFSKNEFDIKIGDCFVMKATPKRHCISNYHGGKETQFNRVVVKEIIGQNKDNINE